MLVLTVQNLLSCDVFISITLSADDKTVNTCSRSIMKHRSWLTINLTLILVLTAHGHITCGRTPKNAGSPKANIDKYVLEITGNPPSYSPGQIYTIVLKTSPSNPIENVFTEFILVVEPENPLDLEVHQTVSSGDLTPINPSITTFTPKCPNAVIQTNTLAKSNVEIKWRAPPSQSGCVAIKATVYESSDSWFIDDGGLTKILCEEEENADVQSPINEGCLACGEAKYEIAFQGMWTRNTHPKDYPLNMWSTKLGDVIGASHKFNRSFWTYGETASEGLKLLAEDGDTSLLEDELKEMSEDVRTIIKARELSYPNITGISYTVFRVDRDNHLVSLVSKITPSPDWIVGVSNFELCLTNGSWIQSRTLNLYPWDVGTDDGVSYNSLDSPSTSRQVVKLITSDNEDSPFYSENGDRIKPLARLHVTRQKLYEKICESDEGKGEEDDSCKLGDWSAWSNCSTTCGQEVMTRDRQLLKPENSELCAKDGPLKLQETVRCANASECEVSENDCVNVSWSDWTPCNETCGSGVKTRHANPPDQNSENGETERKEETTQNEEATQNESCIETVECFNPECETDTTGSGDIITQSDSQVVVSQGPSYGPVVPCKVTNWSAWGPCTATEPCTTGYSFKERHILVHPRNGGKSCPQRLQKAKHCEVPCTEGRTSKEKPRFSGRRRVNSKVIDCKLGPWSEWSPCSSNCGSSAVQQRTRAILVHPSKDGKQCETRIDERKCSLPYACSDRKSLFL